MNPLPPPCRVAVAGLGTAGRLMIPALRAHPGMALAAVADPVADVAEAVAAQFGVPAAGSVEQLVARDDIDAIYLATPTELHADHTRLAAASGKHILCEKPMAVSIDDALEMITAADHAGVVLMVGHSRSYDAPFHHMRALIDAGAIGAVRMILQMSYTDWVYRPRRPDELDPAKGGGVTFRQGAHQFDVLRRLGGGAVVGVTASVFDFDPARPTLGAHSVMLRFADGAVGNAIYSGYGTFSTAELTNGVDEAGFAEDVSAIGQARRALRDSAGDETAAKRERAVKADKGTPPFHPAFGLTLVTGETGDLRQSPEGLYHYSAEGRREILIPRQPQPRDMVVAEFHDAIRGLRVPLHDGRWALANLEICAAVLEAAATGKEVRLHHQVGATTAD
jgi:phthalate 4,5-cis-dihydrodiol dehydrogenase